MIHPRRLATWAALLGLAPLLLTGCRSPGHDECGPTNGNGGLLSRLGLRGHHNRNSGCCPTTVAGPVSGFGGSCGGGCCDGGPILGDPGFSGGFAGVPEFTGLPEYGGGMVMGPMGPYPHGMTTMPPLADGMVVPPTMSMPPAGSPLPVPTPSAPPQLAPVPNGTAPPPLAEPTPARPSARLR